MTDEIVGGSYHFFARGTPRPACDDFAKNHLQFTNLMEEKSSILRNYCADWEQRVVVIYELQVLVPAMANSHPYLRCSAIIAD